MKVLAAYISRKQSWLRFGASLLVGIGIAALFCSLRRGPELGFLYDALLSRRPAFPVAKELLIIDTLPPDSAASGANNVLEPSAVASLIMTLSELDASALVLEAPVLGLSAGSSAGEEEIRYHFDREFDLLNRNVINFFDAIRTGSIAPSDSARYMSDLVELSERGKERLVSTLVTRDEEGVRRLENAAAVFGNVRRPGDLFVQVIRGVENGVPASGTGNILADKNEYSRPDPDSDGVLRRIMPLRYSLDGNGQEHIIFSTLKTRYKRAEIIYAETGPVLVLEENGGAKKELPLDLNGALLFEVPREPEDFRRINLEEFLKYDEADQSLRRILAEAAPLGIFSLIQGEENPLYLYDYALSLRDDLLAAPNGEGKTAWRNARSGYFAGLDRLLYGGSEAALVENLGLALSVYGPGEAEYGEISGRIRSVVAAFSGLRQKYQELLDIRSRLQTNLEGSVCILGPGSAAQEGNPGLLRFPPVKALFPFLSNYLADARNFFTRSTGRNFSDAEASALLANGILTGRVIVPGGELPLFVAAVLAALVAALILRPVKALFSLTAGVIFTVITGLGFSVAFVFSGTWYDPLVPAAAAFSVTVVSSAWAFALRRAFGRKLRVCYGPHVSAAGLRRLVREGKPVPARVARQNAVIIAVRSPALAQQEQHEAPQAAAAAIMAYREKVTGIFTKAGAVAAAGSGELVLACFGSPLERVILDRKNGPVKTNQANEAPAKRALGFLVELVKLEESKGWVFGLDAGVCAFAWSPLSGYSIFGKPVLSARVLSGLTERYNSRILVTGAVTEMLPDLPAKKVGMLRERGDSAGEAFYELLFDSMGSI